jgi:hypothetical protein
MNKEDLKWLSERFKIPESDILWYNSGTCYSRIQVKTKESANKVHDIVKNDTVNGGVLHNMPLGGISEYKDNTGNIYYDVTC